MSILDKHAEKWQPITETGCYIWNVAKGNLYGRVLHNGKQQLAHRAVLIENRGPPPTNKHQASHLCGVSFCVNPNHLIWETAKENAARIPAEVRSFHAKRNGVKTAVILRSRAKGFYWHKKAGKYRAYTRLNGKHVHIGLFITAEDARAAYLSFMSKVAA